MSEGYRSILVEEHTRAIASALVVLPLGSLQDPEGKEGLAYLTGQMLTRGAGALDQAAIADELDFLGSSLAVNVGRETTTLSGDALTRNFDAFEELAGTVLAEPTFPADELAKLKRQTLAELAQVSDSDPALAQHFYMRRLFDGHPYGRPLKGTPSSIARITRQDVHDFYRECYRAQGILLGMAGDADQARLEAFAGRTLARLPAGRGNAVAVPAAPSHDGCRAVMVDKPERSQTQVYMGHSTLHANDPDFLPLLVAQTLFGGTFTATLSKEIREKRGWSYGAYSYLNTDRHLGTFTMRFYPAVADTVPAIRLAQQLLGQLCSDGVSDDEVTFAKRYLSNSHAFSIDTPSRRLHELLMAQLQGRPEGWVDEFVELLAKVETDAVNRAIRRHLRPDDLLVAVVATANTLETELRGWELLDEVTTVDYRDRG